MSDIPQPRILVDADACPVKEEIYRVAGRYRLAVVMVANVYIRVPDDPLFSSKVVTEGFDAADDWIAEQAGAGDIVVTADIPLADRALKSGAIVLDSKGRFFTEGSIGALKASRDAADQVRFNMLATGRGGGPPPFGPKDRSRFLSALDEAVHKGRKAKAAG